MNAPGPVPGTYQHPQFQQMPPGVPQPMMPPPARRPWWRRARLIGPVCGLLGLIVGSGIGGADSSTVAAPAPTVTVTAEAPAAAAPATAEPAAAAPAASPAADGSVSDGEWTATDVQVEEGAFGDFDGTVRLTGPAASAGVVDLTVLVDGKVAGVLSGVISDSEAGETQTVELMSSDEFVDGNYEYDLKVNDF